MASSKAPKHDFAPAWLKIPEHGNQKASGAKSSEHADKAGYYGYPRRRDDMHRGYDFPPFAGNGLARGHRGFDPGYDERHFNGHGLPRGGPYGLEEEFYAAGYYNGGGYPPHPPGYHPAVYHEMNGFHHPGARFHPHHMNMYPHYPYGGDIYNDRYHGNGGGRTRRHSRTEKDSQRTPNKTPNGNAGGDKNSAGERGNAGSGDAGSQGEKNGSGGGAKENGGTHGEKSGGKLDEEFPSLGGGEAESKEEKQDPCKPSAGVWDKNSVDKITNNKHATDKTSKQNGTRDAKNSPNTSIYKALVPSKMGSKRTGKENNTKLGNDSSSATDINSNNSPRQAKPVVNGQASTPPMDVLNTRTVTQPRVRSGNKKSDFLKALKNNDHDLNSPRGNGKSIQNGVDAHLVNGFVDLNVSSDDHSNQDDKLLSSSLEAEQRLLREMGWSEDEEQKPITEEEIREIQELKDQINQLKEQKNGIRKPPCLPVASPPWRSSQAATTTLNGCGDSDSDLSTDSDSDS